MRKVFFRADASGEIGYGHFIRSLALADMLKDDFDCRMFTAAPDAFQISQSAGICRLVALDAGERRFDDFLKLLEGDEIVVLDNYFYTTEYQQKVKAAGCALVCIDDMHDKRYVCDAVVNHGFVSSDEFDVAPGVRLCLGPEYSLLRRPFLAGRMMIDNEGADSFSDAAAPGHVGGGVEDAAAPGNAKSMNVAICFGGSDQLGLAAKCLKILENDPRVGEITVVGSLLERHPCESNPGERRPAFSEARPAGTLQELNAVPHLGRPAVSIVNRLDAEGMASLFRSCNIAVVSMSTVCLEALACGIKVAAGWYVDNQKQGYEEFVRRGLICPLGYLGDGVTSLDGIFSYRGQICPRLDYSTVPGRFVKLFKSL